MKKNNRLQKVSKLYRNRFFYDSNDTFVLLQWPNVPLTVWIICTVFNMFVAGTTKHILSTVATLSLIVWAVLELTTGATYLRRILGLCILLYIVMSRMA